MSRDRGIPEYKPPQPSPLEGRKGRQIKPVALGREASTPREQASVPSVPASVPPVADPSERGQPGRSQPLRQAHQAAELTSEQFGSAAGSSPATGPQRRRQGTRSPKPRTWMLKQRFLHVVSSWQFMIAASFLVCTGASTLAAAFLFQLPGLPNCPAVFWPLASASMRFECARIAASKQTAKDLLEAIALVDGLPADHAMRAEADRLIELWSQEVLKLADELFNQGKLDEAIAAARKIPAKVTAFKLVEDRVKQWQTIWADAEDIYRKAEAALRQRDWRRAFQMAVQLLDINNKYWQTTRYDDLNKRINTARADGNKLFQAEALADTGTLANLLKAIKLADEIQPDSYVYKLAQEKIQGFGQKMLDLAQSVLDRRDLQQALSIVNQIPEKAKLESSKKEFTVLANAQFQAWQDTVPALEEAIVQAQRIRPGQTFYPKAKQLIARWQQEIEGLAQLERARLLAQGGSVEALLSAIASASQVSSSNPRWNEAQTQIQRWQAEVQTIEDQPLLDQAEQFASAGDMASLQTAVAQASQIAPGRALSKTANRKVQEWTRQIQQIEDQPYLDQARAFAFAGNLTDAINVAEQIRPGRSLYEEAQADVRKWRGQIQAEVEQVQAQTAQAQAQRNLQEARQMASVGNSNALTAAIRLASQVSTSGTVQAEINNAVNGWSWQLLQLAKEQAGLNPAGAIAIAQKIPAQSAAYQEAQAQIAVWQQQSGKP